MKARWIMVVAAGMVALIVLILSLRSHGTVEGVPMSMIAEAARKSGTNPGDFADIIGAMNRTERTGEASDRDWQIIQKNLASPDVLLHKSAVTAVAQLKHSKRHRYEAIQIAHALKSSSDEYDRTFSLRIFYACEAPGWQDEIRAHLQDRNPLVRNDALRLAHKATLHRNASFP